ncbi:dihydropteroate synthase [Colwellia sp. 1_MG-2023]|uniref:dihydropteroate synthase n=1 Tax=unclassified Colwellia TaxID=196834 RepID=UPI001C07F3EF|nr:MULTISPECIES: dihydropteroate synthase [unclassified Colwellia]MBU2924644.1 dihydropteroate synthase [Colwellia sp. C2M11]MDO6653900.1 dihydropteroate synthase [Colwellia sp. 3_MG-2023]MDO6666727.1 dihydropteroate synthase [Colwellia sp. 2_MG-2023]MDO6691168.1 dihydropteroate synthase [Colwellia sp. 1_MG-2023]
MSENSRNKQSNQAALADLSNVQVMGIVNVTPDSFSDGGKFAQFDQALKQVELMIENGVDIIDIGGESTRPGAIEVSETDEVTRVIPLLKAIKSRFNICVSIDTSKAVVMNEAITYGADMINDVRALQNEGCLDVIAQSDVSVCLMHMKGLPKTMQQSPQYTSIIDDIVTFFEERIRSCKEKGINSERLILDPGFGFGKTLEHNYQMLAQFSLFKKFNLPLLAGTSRKSMLGNLLNRDVDQRLAGSLATAILAVQQGANIVRVHDVAETVDAIKILNAVAKHH